MERGDCVFLLCVFFLCVDWMFRGYHLRHLDAISFFKTEKDIKREIV